MSDANMQQGTQAATTSDIPVNLLANTTTDVNPWEVNLKETKRTVKGPAARKAVQDQNLLKGDKVTVVNRHNPKGFTSKVQNIPGGFDFISKYTTSAQVSSNKLIDKNGYLSRDQYNPSKDAEVELAQMSDSDRKELLNGLYQREFFPGKTQPSVTGRDSASVAAMEQFLMAVNATGYTWDVAKPIVFSQYQATQGLPGSGGSAPKYSISSEDDIINIANKVAEQTIGRRLSSTEVGKIVGKVHARERSAGQSQANETEQAPSPQTIAQNQVEQQYGQEAAMMRFGQLGASLDALLKGM